MRDSATYLTNSEIAILFIRSVIKHSIPEEPSIPLPAKESPRSWEKEFRILVARVTEISIPFVRFAVKHSFQKNFLLHCLPKIILVLEKRSPDSYSKSSWNCDAIHKIFN